MDLAQTLVRSVLRQFYEPKFVLVIDALIIHSALRDDDMAYLLGMNTKELHKLCGKLKEDRWLAVHSRSEAKEGTTRPVNRTYYYIDYRATIDAIKFKVLTISKKVQGSTVPEDERIEYLCKKCKKEYTMLDATVLQPAWNGEGLECSQCDSIVVENPNANLGGHVQSTAWTSQIKYIMDLLQKIDTVIIPPNPFETAYASALPVQRDVANPGSETAPVETTLNRPTAVKGLTDTGPKNISITVTDRDGPSEADIRAEAEKKKTLAAANEMPTHFAFSTVTGDRVKSVSASDPVPVPVKSSQPTDEKPKNILSSSMSAGKSASANSTDDIANYFARLKEEQASEAKKEAEENYESEDEDEFEDVLPNGPSTGTATGTGTNAAGSVVNTPTSSNGLDSPSKNLPALASVLKKSGAGGGGASFGGGSQSNSGTSTGATSPTGGGGGISEGERAAKRVRIEEPVKVKEEVDSEEEDVEFEDV